jgi:Sigma 54 modulation/S30EA ribosomal protein C terminus
VAAETPDEAVFDMESLDHDFFLFTNLDTGDDNAVHRAGDGYEIIQPTPAPENLVRYAVRPKAALSSSDTRQEGPP